MVRGRPCGQDCCAPLTRRPCGPVLTPETSAAPVEGRTARPGPPPSARGAPARARLAPQDHHIRSLHGFRGLPATGTSSPPCGPPSIRPPRTSPTPSTPHSAEAAWPTWVEAPSSPPRHPIPPPTDPATPCYERPTFREHRRSVLSKALASSLIAARFLSFVRSRSPGCSPDCGSLTLLAGGSLRCRLRGVRPGQEEHGEHDPGQGKAG